MRKNQKSVLLALNQKINRLLAVDSKGVWHGGTLFDAGDGGRDGLRRSASERSEATSPVGSLEQHDLRDATVLSHVGSKVSAYVESDDGSTQVPVITIAAWVFAFDLIIQAATPWPTQREVH